MKRILVVGAGGTPAANFIRSLRAAPEPFHIIGTDCDKFNLQRAESDERYLVPRADDADYVEVLNDIVQETGCQFLHIQNDSEMEYLSAQRDQLQVKTFLPDQETVKACLNKWASYELWRDRGIRVPESFVLNNPEDLEKALQHFGGRIWIRDQTGAGGRGSMAATDLDLARAWIQYHEGWGHYTAAKCLQADTVTVQSIWNEGELVVTQGRKRLYWELGKATISGVSGVTGTGVTVSDPLVDRVAEEAVRAVSTIPHGIYGVDMTYDEDGTPNPTEINIGRFFTTHEFFTQCGLNMAYIVVCLGLGEPLPVIERRVNPLPEGLAWIRGVDFLPTLSSLEEIDAAETELATRRSKSAKCLETAS